MRIDTYLFQNNKYSSRTKAAEAIARGEVFVNGKIVATEELDQAMLENFGQCPSISYFEPKSQDEN